MDNILVSIIVPAYNIESYIGRCLESILNQSHKKIEILVIDDGSTDGTWNVIKHYAAKDQRIVAMHKENGGVSSTRRVGLEHAQGEYIGFVDGDDYVEPEMYEHLLMNALKYNADISHCGYRMIYPDGHIDYYYGTEQLRIQDHETALLDLLLGEQIEPSLCNKLFHQKTLSELLESSHWNEDIRINEDLLLNYYLFKQSNASVYEDKAFYHYILRKGSAATSKKERYKTLDPLKVISIIKEDVSDNNKLSIVVYQRYLRCLINIAVQQDWKEDAHNARKTLKEEIFSKRFFEECLPIKLKLIVIGVAFFCGGYRLVRKVYELITGVSNKYKI